MEKININGNLYYNGDCIEGCRDYVSDGSIDIIITDPPYGIAGDELHQHYNRNEAFVVDGYVEVPAEEYEEFSQGWIKEAARILRPNGSIYIVSGYTNLIHILNALKSTDLQEVNHIIWKYNFGVHTRRKYVSSHYHILYYEKPGPGKRTFFFNSRYGQSEKAENGGSLNYQDREDVWIINREYKPGQKKNKNELPSKLLKKMIQYSSNEGDLVCDLFMGGFSTARVAIGLNRRFVGFELSQAIYNEKVEEMRSVKAGDLLGTLREPQKDGLFAQGKPWTEEEVASVLARYDGLRSTKKSKAACVQIMTEEFGRGRFSIEKVLKEHRPSNEEKTVGITDITQY
jgi:site-specific DNA-methyltransferase (adenine-specific)